MAPAIAGVGRFANNRGTTKKPMVVREPHHRQAANTGKRWPISPFITPLNVVNRDDFEMLDAAWRLHFRRIAHFLADQCTRNR